MDSIIPKYDSDDNTHWYIWHSLAHELTADDFEAIQSILSERSEMRDAIDYSCVTYVKLANGMYQPRIVEQSIKDEAYKYTDWKAAMDICLILSKYAKFYSNL